LINKQTFDVITAHSHKELEATEAQLKTYTGEAFGEEQQQLVVYVVAGNGPNLMGRDWLYTLEVSYAGMGPIF